LGVQPVEKKAMQEVIARVKRVFFIEIFSIQIYETQIYYHKS
jgi:hypothetical protein